MSGFVKKELSANEAQRHSAFLLIFILFLLLCQLGLPAVSSTGDRFNHFNRD